MSELIVLRCATRRVLTKSCLPLRSVDGLSVEWVFLLLLLRRDGKCDFLPLPRACPVVDLRCGLAFLSALRRSSPNELLRRVAVFLNDEAGDVAATGVMGALMELFIGGGCEGGCGTANSFKRSIGDATASALFLFVSGAKPHSVRSSCANSTGKSGALWLNPRLFGGPLFGEFGSNIELGSNVGTNVGDPMLALESESGVSGDFKLEI